MNDFHTFTFGKSQKQKEMPYRLLTILLIIFNQSLSQAQYSKNDTLFFDGHYYKVLEFNQQQIKLSSLFKVNNQSSIVTLKHYSGYENEFYEKTLTKPLDYVWIDNIDLSKLTDSLKKYHIEIPIILNHVHIENLTCKSATFKSKFDINGTIKNIDLFYCLFNENCSINNHANPLDSQNISKQNFTNCTFKKDFRIINQPINGWFVPGYSSIMLGGYKGLSSYAWNTINVETTIADCKFNMADFTNKSNLSLIEINKCSFIDKFYFNSGKSKIQDCVFLAPAIMYSNDENEFKLRNCAFEDSVRFNYFKLDSLFSLSNCLLKRTVIFENCNFDKYKTKIFDEAYFLEKSTLEIPVDFSLFNYSLQNICNITFTTQEPLTDIKYYEFQSWFYRLKSKISIQYENSPQKISAIEKIEYQENLLEKIHAKNTNSYLKYFQKLFVEYTVNYGYKGEKNIVLWALSTILIFSFLYFLLRSETIKNYILLETITQDSQTIKLPWKELLKRSSKNQFIIFFQCIWFSLVVFVNPRFPSKYFKFDQNLLLIILAEWLMGLVLVMMYLYFIASKYPLFRTLINI